MMTFFPIPYKDELLYSILARYHIRSGNISYKATIEDVFGSKTAAAVVDLPCNIENLINNMPVNETFTTQEIIDSYTNIPFYGAFLSSERARQIRNSMLGSRGGDIYSRIGLMASNIIANRFLKFCPVCIKEDYKNYGEMYWHRIHQIPGVICPQHGVLLLDSKVLLVSYNKHLFTAGNFDNCRIPDKSVCFSKALLKKLSDFSLDVKYLFDNKFPNREGTWFKKQYIEILKEKNYATVNGRLYRKRLFKDFNDFYGKEFLQYVQSEINPYSQTNWLTDLIYSNNKTSHPIRHLILIRFLQVSISDIFYKDFDYKPFGTGPWICLNSVASHYLQPAVEEMKVSHGLDNKKPIGTFYCDCGFVYTRSGKDIDESSKYTYTKIKQFGYVWEERLKEVIDRKLSLRETAKKMGVDPATIKKYAKKLGIQAFWHEHESKKQDSINKIIITDNEYQKTEQYRNAWLSLCRHYPNKGKKELRLINEKTYIWLYRHDKQWLTDNSPHIKRKYVNKRVDWNQRDCELLFKVKEVVKEFKNEDIKPKRISIASIGSKLGVKALLEKHLDKLPKTKAFIESVIETDKDFRARRVKWAIRVMKDEGEEIKEWKILRKAGIRKEFVDEIEEYIRL